jgi:hypothetical protein
MSSRSTLFFFSIEPYRVTNEAGAQNRKIAGTREMAKPRSLPNGTLPVIVSVTPVYLYEQCRTKG